MNLTQAYQLFHLDFGSSYQLAEVAYYELLLRLQNGEVLTDIYGNLVNRQMIDTAFQLIKEHHQRKSSSTQNVSGASFPKPPSSILKQWEPSSSASSEPTILRPKPLNTPKPESEFFFSEPTDIPKIELRTTVEMKPIIHKKHPDLDNSQNIEESSERVPKTTKNEENRELQTTPISSEIRTSINYRPTKPTRTLRIPVKKSNIKEENEPSHSSAPFRSPESNRTTDLSEKQPQLSNETSTESSTKNVNIKPTRIRLLSSSQRKRISSKETYSDDSSTLLIPDQSENKIANSQSTTFEESQNFVGSSPQHPRKLITNIDEEEASKSDEATDNKFETKKSVSGSDDYMKISGHWHDYNPSLSETELMDVQFAFNRSIGRKERERKVFLIGLILVYLAIVAGILLIKVAL